MNVVTEQELAEFVAQTREPLSVRGGNSRRMAGRGAPLSVAGMTGITLYEPGALTMVARAGTPLAEIEAALARENQRLAFEPIDHSGLVGAPAAATIGGVFASNASGPRRLVVGAARDFLLGVRFVDGRGVVVKNGGRVMKNVTGYDLVKLLAGSFGTLGVLSEVSFKVMPRVETQISLVLQGLDDMAAVAAMSRAMGSPYEVTGAAHDPAAARTVLRLEGFEASVAYRSARLREMLKESGAEMTLLDEAGSDAFWCAQRNVAAFQQEVGDVWRVSCKPSDAPGLVQRAQAQAHLLDWAGGLIWVRLPAGSDLRARLGSFTGHATLVRGTDETKVRLGVFQPQPAAIARVSAAVRAKFDPKGLFNAGLMDAVG
ncbi:FAD-binding protein [Sulfitobacter sp. F26204]|uniref:FAD-binding protein n=1 Tax=Sulfitobacter sp. F26204 TaxID=2996014 RepID=UPI00225E485B|nr:FAD-binding protein [Sulfitobacter sp. F26204]MCX7558433.1 FAD-binding protein [Sulfitobacter sp. F26204]